MQVRGWTGMAVEMVPPKGCLLDRPFHPLELPIGPRVPGFGQPVFDVVRVAAMSNPANGACFHRWLNPSLAEPITG